LNDIDDLIYSFWHVAAFDSQWLIDAMWELEISLAQWEHMKKWHPVAARDKALKCLFLNRTSFSGILNSKAGPLGGKKQSSRYPIGCRFSKPTIQHRLRRIAALGSSGAIESVWNYDWKDCIEITKKSDRMGTHAIFIYLDPPFYAKADSLYRHSFSHEEHIRLAGYLQSLDTRWILSYDDHPEIRRLYHPNNFPSEMVRQFSAAYRAGSRSREATELIVTNLRARL
jgi:DNA adenine methylase